MEMDLVFSAWRLDGLRTMDAMYNIGLEYKHGWYVVLCLLLSISANRKVNEFRPSSPRSQRICDCTKGVSLKYWS